MELLQLQNCHIVPYGHDLGYENMDRPFENLKKLHITTRQNDYVGALFQPPLQEFSFYGCTIGKELEANQSYCFKGSQCKKLVFV
jgi:hypothetical protein